MGAGVGGKATSGMGSGAAGRAAGAGRSAATAGLAGTAAGAGIGRITNVLPCGVAAAGGALRLGAGAAPTEGSLTGALTGGFLSLCSKIIWKTLSASRLTRSLGAEAEAAGALAGVACAAAVCETMIVTAATTGEAQRVVIDCGYKKLTLFTKKSAVQLGRECKKTSTTFAQSSPLARDALHTDSAWIDFREWFLPDLSPSCCPEWTLPM